jgi:hypothetical protein
MSISFEVNFKAVLAVVAVSAVALVIAGAIGYQLGQPHQGSKAEQDRIHAHNMTNCGVAYGDLGSAGMGERTLEQINRHDNPIYNCRAAEQERYFGEPEGSFQRLPIE